jgi:hypothetical protein
MYCVGCLKLSDVFLPPCDCRTNSPQVKAEAFWPSHDSSGPVALPMSPEAAGRGGADGADGWFGWIKKNIMKGCVSLL